MVVEVVMVIWVVGVVELVRMVEVIGVVRADLEIGKNSNSRKLKTQEKNSYSSKKPS